MKTKYNIAVVYDLETGGLNHNYSSITEVALVAVDLEGLEISESTSVVFKPYIDLSWISSPIKDAKTIYKNNGERDLETGIKTLKFKGHSITLKNIEPLTEDLVKFYAMVNDKYPKLFLDYEDIVELEGSMWGDVLRVFFNNAYSQGAFEATGISRDILEKEGVSYKEVYSHVKNFLTKHTLGNCKPLLVGHNIGSLPRRIVRGKEVAPDGFDNPFMEKFFQKNGDDFFYCINDEIIDTIKWARLKWTELPNFTLGTCANEVGLTLKEAHRALPDTVANAKFYIKMMQHLRGEGVSKSKYKRRRYHFQI